MHGGSDGIRLHIHQRALKLRTNEYLVFDVVCLVDIVHGDRACRRRETHTKMSKERTAGRMRNGGGVRDAVASCTMTEVHL
jgi:hypothetical protein